MISSTTSSAGVRSFILNFSTSLLLGLLFLCSSSAYFLGLNVVALIPGQTVLGEMRLWTFVTASFVETSPSRFIFSAIMIVWLGFRSEAPVGRHTSARIAFTCLLAAFVGGLQTAVGGISAFVSSGKETSLYAPNFGSGPLLGALSVLAYEVYGEQHIFAIGNSPVPLFRYSLIPLTLVLFGTLSQFAWNTASDAFSTVTGIVVSWVYLRYFCAHGDGLIGDARVEFEFLNMFPEPLRTALRPIEKMGRVTVKPVLLQMGAICSGKSSKPAAATQLLPTVAPSASIGVSGGLHTSLTSSMGIGAGGTSSPGTAIYGIAAENLYGSSSSAAAQRIDLHVQLQGSSGGGGSALAADPIAERRREKALRALDNRLAALKSKIKTGVSGLSTPSLPQSISTS
jgi:hypothetical protein